MQLQQSESTLTFSTDHLSVVVNKRPLRISFYKDKQLLIAEEKGLMLDEQKRGFRFLLSDKEKLLGGGQRILGMDRRGHKMPLYNRAHYGYASQSNQMYYGLPAVMSDRKYALVFDNSAKGTLDIGHAEPDILSFDAVGGRTAYLVVAGDKYPQLINHFTAVTGRQPLPPRWALGNFASRFGYRTESEARNTVEAFRKEDIPLDALVLDLFWFGPEIRGFMGNLDWDKEAFPNPEKMIQNFNETGVKTVLITEPFVLTASSNWQETDKQTVLAKNAKGNSKVFDFFFGETGLIDVFRPEAQMWFADVYANLYEQGVRGWWGDLGESEVHPSDAIHLVDGQNVMADEIHNAYGHKWAELVYEAVRKGNNTRPMLLKRSGFVGSQRYGVMPWTGDVSRSWGGLASQIELTLQMSVFGLAYTHSDLGGYAGGETFDREMYIRWLQYGVFQPAYRPHAQEKIPSEPVFHDQLTKDIVREYVKLRYKLLPYNYSLSFVNSLSGMPLMRPMMFEDEAKSAWVDIKDQFLWGDAFLVNPVTEPEISEVNVILPEGYWFDFWSDEVHRGSQTIKVKTKLDHLPVYVRAGIFVPMSPVYTSTEFYSTEKLTLHYYHHGSIVNAKGVMYDDDGKTTNTIEQHKYQTLSFTSSHLNGIHQFSLKQQGEYPGMPTLREITLVVHNWTKSLNKVSVGKQPLLITVSEKELANQKQGAWHDKEHDRLQIKLLWSSNTHITIE